MQQPALNMESKEGELEHILELLKRLPNVTKVGQSKYNGSDLNRMDVHLFLEHPGDKGHMIRRSGSATFDTKLSMAKEVLRRVTQIMGAEVVRGVEEEMNQGNASSRFETLVLDLSEEDAAWLHAWYDSHESPELVTFAQASAAYAQHKSGSALVQHLREVQFIDAKIRSAEIRRDRAVREVDRFKRDRENAMQKAVPKASSSRTSALSPDVSLSSHLIHAHTRIDSKHARL